MVLPVIFLEARQASTEMENLFVFISQPVPLLPLSAILLGLGSDAVAE